MEVIDLGTDLKWTMICYPSSALVGPYKSISYTQITNCTIIIFTRNNTNVASLGAVEILSISIKLKEEKYVSAERWIPLIRNLMAQHAST